ncbi:MULTISPECIES: bifunctional methylenetetrahydrofolate dehydrogenase/methenyltetrahydrofolate cyclohydrolase FolD [Hydrocarboniphaga]|jgi:methylenetetrahydrofolate dehydrogenase (NADP+)/methenyltetrahydrofolate cyclohydrolase|uniref:Bifunctional protein FolD n=1 Tax=Hydrocarboniphaga effusa AP103 TaxID=1172194 RepID=I8T3G3_9GAMM|nr:MULTISPECIES: bifunctional methylenetetrahydrofolate dehydrogenase/methenyltetrahydrofolate cyclohydrolase FolD [Hydrocarboniphaga]EIT68253.1 methylenetetrahydrofolate dehydrogenase [Hydrocarboniphaga effusa AP103]MDZ4078758.1 bifunctional methylenetetrahydrofolate dehydrogenase/methenyltetrahydrofolate cyclohydrolase FolD [Hydrocarboniphaga sp.]
MSAKLIDGKSIADTLQQELRSRVAGITASGRRAPALATLLVGADPASHVYVRNKRLACERIGVRSLPLEFGSGISQAELLAEIERLNNDPEVDGILVQLPLPAQIDSTAIIEAIRPDKDVDGFHPYNLGRLAQRQPVLRPCTPFGVIEMLRRSGETFYGRRAIVVGASNHVGRPMGLELLLAGATTTVCHRFTRDLADEVARAEIVIVAVGKPGFIKGDWIAPGATVVDIGINRLPDGKLCGDVEFDVARQRAARITPVPGGVGPMTVTMLMHNTVLAATR